MDSIQHNQEYLENKLDLVKSFLEDNFSDIYQDLPFNIKPHYGASHNGGGFFRGDKGIRAYTTESDFVKMDDLDLVETIFEVSMKRKVAYTVSVLHEYCEGLYIFADLKTKSDYLTKFDLVEDSKQSMSHLFATAVELEALDILIKNSSEEDKSDYLLRKQVRLDDLS